MRRKILAVCLGALVTLGARAQALELGLQEAIEIALDENPTIRVAGLEIERQRYVKNETIGNFLPSLTAEGSYTRAIEQATMGGMSFYGPDTWQGGATVGMPLVVPALFQTLKLNDQQMRAAVEAARASKLDMVNQVRKAYYGILMAEEALAVLRSSEAMVAKTVDDTRTKFQNELASEYDLVTAEVQLSNIQPLKYQAENGLQSAQKMFRMLLGLPEDTEFGLKDNLRDLAQSAAGEALERSDVSANSDLRAMDIQHNLLKRQLGLLRTQRMPSLVAFGNVTFMGQVQRDVFSSMSSLGPEIVNQVLEAMGQSPRPLPPPTPVRESFEWQHPINVGARLSVPLFAGFTNVSRERQLKNTIKQLELSRDYLEEGVQVQADNMRANVGTAYGKMQAGAQTITQAQKGYDISKVRFDGGMGTILELNSAELALTQARMNYAQAVYDYLSAQADYEKIVGRDEY
jgi:outer membrane protein TolC